jgi:uncharacterized membrane protein
MGLTTLGLVHTVFACLALCTGTLVLILGKGTATHRKLGYAYVCLMLLMNLSAFGIYRLSNGPGIFHFLALVSLFTIAGGLYCVWQRHTLRNWQMRHARFMAWSMVGLYAALVSEIATRLPLTRASGGLCSSAAALW